MILSDFAAAAVLITFGSLLGRTSPFQLFAIAFCEVIFYSLNEALNIYVFKAADIGGSMLIHTFGTYFGLSCSVCLYYSKVIWLYYNRANDDPPGDRVPDSSDSVYHSDIFAMIGKEFVSITITLFCQKVPYFSGCSGPVSMEH